MGIERIISVFDKSECLIDEINVDKIGLDQLKKIFKARQDDPEMAYVYNITEAKRLEEFVDVDFDFFKIRISIGLFSSIGYQSMCEVFPTTSETN